MAIVKAKVEIEVALHLHEGASSECAERRLKKAAEDVVGNGYDIGSQIVFKIGDISDVRIWENRSAVTTEVVGDDG